MKKTNEATQKRIEAQRAIVATLEPGSLEHEVATKVLLLLQDSLLIHQQIDELTSELKKMR